MVPGPGTPIQSLTGCDSTSAFKGKGKVRPMKLVLKSPSFCSTFSKLGESWEVSDDLVTEIERFVCVLYGGVKTKLSSVDELRAFMLKAKCDENYSLSVIKNVDFAAFPPSKACLIEHIRRVNYQVRIWKMANHAIYELPKLSDGHDWVENGEPRWCGPEWILSPPFTDVLDDSISNYLDDIDDDNEDDGHGGPELDMSGSDSESDGKCE